MAKVLKNFDSAKADASRRLAEDENIVRLWRFESFYVVHDSREAERLARACSSSQQRMWHFDASRLQEVLSLLIRAGVRIYLF